jgi:phosphate transport system substrate-binding protein
MPTTNMKFFILFTAFLVSLSAPAEARDQIRVVGSSTVFPFITAAAEQFGQSGSFKTPIVESTGTGGGLKLFCEGASDATPDIANASRAIMESEKALCAKNGVIGVTEFAIGYDGIVIAADKKSPVLNLTRNDVFLALARQIPKDGKLVANIYTKWKEINPTLADEPIEVYGPPPTSGTRDAFVELAMESVCKDMPEFKAAYADEKERGKACKAIREDGKYIDSGEDDNVIVQKLKSNPHALGVFGYSYLAENSGAIQAMKIDGLSPTIDAISNGSYKLSRKLYIYVKNDHLGKVPGLAEFIREITSPTAMGADGYMAAKGMIPLHKDEVEAVRKQAAALK